MSDGIRVDLLGNVSDAARELWDACGIGVAFIDAKFAKMLPSDVPAFIRCEPDVAGRVGVYTIVLRDVEMGPFDD